MVREIYFENAVNYDDSLWRAAAESGVDANYWDIFGRQHHVTREALQAILQATGWDTASFDSLEEARRRRFSREAERGLPETAVVGEDEKSVSLTVSAHEAGTARLSHSSRERRRVERHSGTRPTRAPG